MARRNGWLLGLVALVVAAAGAGAAEATAAPPAGGPAAGGAPDRPTGPVANLLRDGSMETTEGDSLTAWHLAQPRDGTVVMSACRENVRDGAACMLLRGVATWACGEGERIPVTRGRTYALQGFARATCGDVFLQISYWREGKWLGCTQSDAVTTDGDWQLCTAVSEPGRFPDAAEVSISGTARGGSVEAWFDGLVFTAGPPPAPAPAAGTAEPR